MQVPNIPKLRVPGLYTPGLRALEVPLPVMGNREFSMPRVFTDPVLNMRVRQYYETETNNILTQLGGRVAGAGVGAGTGALLGSTIGAIVGLIATIAGAVSPVPGDEVAGASLLTSSMASFSATGSKIGAGVGAVAGAVVSDYTTYHAMNDLIKNTMAMVKENPGAGALNALYTVGKSMDIMSGGEAIRASIYSLVNGENALENIAKSYGLTYEGRRDFDTETIRKSLGVDLGRFGNFVIDLFGDLVTDPGFIGAIGAMKLSSKAGQNLFEVALDQAVKEADSINKLFTEAIDNPKLQKHLYKALLEKDYSTIITEVAKRKGSTELTAKAVRKFVDTVNDASRKHVSNNLYNLFKNIDNVDDIVTGYLFKTALPPLGGLSLAKKGYKLVRKYVGITDGTSLGKLNYLVFGNAAKYNFEDYLDQDLEKMYNSEVAKWVRMQYGETTPDTSKVIMKIDGTDYTVNQLYRDVDKLKELQEKEVLLKDEDILLKQQIELRLATAKDFLNDELKRINKEIEALDPNKVVDIKITDDGFDSVLELYRTRGYLEWWKSTIVDEDSIYAFRKIMRDIQRIFSRATDVKDKYGKHVKYELQSVDLLKAFNTTVNNLIKFVNDFPEIGTKLRSRYYVRFINMIKDNIDDGIKKSITDLFKASSESFEQGRKALDEKYDILKNKSEKIIDKINNTDTSYQKYTDKTKAKRPMTEEQFLNKQIKDLDKLNKTIDEINNELTKNRISTRLNVNSYLYKHLVNDKFILDNASSFKYVEMQDGKKEYVELLDAIRRSVVKLNEMDLTEIERKKIVDEIVAPYTNYFSNLEMAPEVAAIFQTDINMSNVFNDTFNFNTNTFKDIDLSDGNKIMYTVDSVIENKKNWAIDQLNNKFNSTRRKADLEVLIDRLSNLQTKYIDGKDISFWNDIIKITGNNKAIAGKLITIMFNRDQYKINEILTYAKDLMSSKANPAVIIYLDHYISTFDKHIKRLEMTRQLSSKDMHKIEKLIDLLSLNRSKLFKRGYDKKLFSKLQSQVRTLDNYFTTQHIISSIERAKYHHIDELIKYKQAKRSELAKTMSESSPKIQALDKEIQELSKQNSALTGEVFEMKNYLHNVLEKHPGMFTVKDPTDYAFDFAINSLTSNFSRFTEDNGYRFSKAVTANTLSVLHQLAPYDKLSRQLLNYIEPLLINLKYNNLEDVNNRLKTIITISSQVQTFRESQKVMREFEVLTKTRIHKDKFIVTLRDGTELTDYFTISVPKREKVWMPPTRNNPGYTTYHTSYKREPNFSFDAARFKKYVLDNNIDLEKNKIDINKLPALNDNFNSDYVIPVDEVFQDVINGRPIDFSPKNHVVFNKKATAVNPKRFFYIDNEGTDVGENIGNALIQQLHILEVDAKGKIKQEMTMFIDPREFETLTTNGGKYKVSDKAIEVNGLSLKRLEEEAAKGNCVTLKDMKEIFEGSGCLDDDAVVIAHNGNGYDFGVLINNFYNDANEKIFDEKGRLLDGMSSRLPMNTIDSLEMTKSLFNRGKRLTNVELAKQSGIKVRTVMEAPNENNIVNTDDITEYIYKKDGKIVVEQYFQGKPIHDAEPDTRLTKIWNIQQIQEIQQLIPSDADFYDFISDPNSFTSKLSSKSLAFNDYALMEIAARPGRLKLLSRIIGTTSRGAYDVLNEMDYKSLSSVLTDLEDGYYVDSLIEELMNKSTDVEGVYRSTVDRANPDYNYYKGLVKDLHSTLENVYNTYKEEVNKYVNFLSKNTNMGVQHTNTVFVQTALNNTILLDTDFNMFRNILSGNSNAFDKDSTYWVLADAFKSIDSEKARIARQYFNDLYDSAMWQNSFYNRHGTNNIDAVHQLMDLALKDIKEFDDVEVYREYLKDVLSKHVKTLSETKDSPVTLREDAIHELISYICSKFDQPEYPLTISGDLTNKMYKYIKEEIMDKIATAEDLNKILDDDTESIDEFYNKFNTSFHQMLDSFRSLLSGVKKQNRVYELEPIDLNAFSAANGVRPYELPLYNTMNTIKYTKVKIRDTQFSRVAKDIFEGCYKNSNTPNTNVLNFGSTVRGDWLNQFAKWLGMDTLEMMRLSRYVKNLDDKAVYDVIWDDLLADTSHPYHKIFIRVQAILDSITEDNASYIADIALYKRRLRNVFLSNYIETKALLYNDLELSNRVAQHNTQRIYDNWKLKSQEFGGDSEALKAVRKQRKEFYDTVKDTFNAEDFVTRVGKSDTSRTARLNNIKTNIKAVQDSNDIFQNIKSMFNGDANEFSKFFRDRRDLVLVNLDDKFQIKLMDTDNISNVEAILSSNQTNKFAIMSRDIYWQVVNKTQPIVLPKWLESMHKYWVLPTKLFSLWFSMPYMIKNITSAYLQNVTANGHRPIKAIRTLLETAKSYHQWKELFNLITSDNKTIYNLLGDFDDVNMHWIDLISSPKKKDIFIKKLNEELADKSGKEAIKIQRLLEILNGLTDADLLTIKEMSEFANTNATFGELTDLQRNININRSKNEELDRLRVKDKLNDDERHHLWLHNNRPNGEFGTTWQDELNELNAKQNKVSDDYYRMNIIKQYMHDDGYVKHMNNVQKYTGMKSWMDFNSDIEAIFRISMVKDQIEMGADLSQATQKVMDTHFIYNDKSLGMKLLEIIFPFASYPMKAANLFLDLAGDSSFVKTMYLWNKYSWGEEDNTTSSYLQHRKAQGDLPIGNRLLHLGNAFTESLTALSNPLGAMNDKLTPLLKLPVDALTNAEYSRAPQLAGQLYNPVRAIEDMQKTGQFHAGSLFNTTQAYYNYQNNYDKGYYKNYPQRSYLYKNMYTSGGYSRVAMNMQQTTLNNLQYRVGSILYNARYRHR